MNYKIDDNKLILYINKDNIEKVFKKIKSLIKKCDKENLMLEIEYDDIKNEDLDMIQTAINIKDRENEIPIYLDTRSLILSNATRIIKAQQGAIIVLVIAFCIALFGWHSCISAM